MASQITKHAEQRMALFEITTKFGRDASRLSCAALRGRDIRFADGGGCFLELGLLRFRLRVVGIVGTLAIIRAIVS